MDLQSICQHLEVDNFGIYSVNLAGRLEHVTLLRCSLCGRYVTLDGREISEDAIVSRRSMSRTKLRTLTAQLNAVTFQELEDLVAKETEGSDASKLMNEIVALGLKQYKMSNYNNNNR